MEAFSSTQFNLLYTPSTLSAPESASIILHHPEVGTWQYEVEGIGELPGVMMEHSPSAVVGQMSSYMMSFRNPFEGPLMVEVVLRVDDDTQKKKKAGGGHHYGVGFEGEDDGFNDECTLSDSEASGSVTGSLDDDGDDGDGERNSRHGSTVTAPDFLGGGGGGGGAAGPVFSLLLKKKRGIVLPTFGSMQIPVCT